MTDKEKVDIKISISSLEDLGYTFQKPDKSIPTERIDFSLIHRSEISEDKKNITILLKPRFTYGKRDPKLIAEFIFKVEYGVEGLEDVIKENEEGDKSIPDGLAGTFFSIAYSTMRGAFFEKGKGTMVERLIIPIVNPVEILKDSEKLDDEQIEIKD